MGSQSTLTYLKVSVVSEISVWCKFFHLVHPLVLRQFFYSDKQRCLALTRFFNEIKKEGRPKTGLKSSILFSEYCHIFFWQKNAKRHLPLCISSSDISGYHADFHEGHGTVGAWQGHGMPCVN